MGFHICEYCRNEREEFIETSSGDVQLVFHNGHFYQMPDMLVHYIRDHSYRPPQEFIDDVMRGDLLAVAGYHPRLDRPPTLVGYLTGDFPKGEMPRLFVYVLAGMMAIAAKQGTRLQTRGI